MDLTKSTNPNATELQRRIFPSQYAMRVNSAATGQPPQESGLVYNGWWGKFHLEMLIWHCAQWATWDDNNILIESSRLCTKVSCLARRKELARWAGMESGGPR